jgi:DNA-binding CsgD family transcriptional regulator
MRTENRSNATLSREEIHALSCCCEGEQHLMVSVFDNVKKRFLYHTDSFVAILGYSKQELTKGGWDFWFNQIKPEELPGIRTAIEHITGKQDFFDRGLLGPIFSYHIQDSQHKWYLLQHQVSLLMSPYKNLLISYLYDFSNKERIENALSQFRFSTQKQICDISNREKEVLRLIGEGYSSREIADRLFISIHTAITHRKHLIEKFAVKNTAQLIKEASKSDLI